MCKNVAITTALIYLLWYPLIESNTAKEIISMFCHKKIFKMTNVSTIKKQQIVSTRIFQDSEITFYLFTFDMDESVSEQSNSEDILIYVLEGQIQLYRDKIVTTANTHELLAIPRNTMHRVHSTSKSKILQLSLVSQKGEEMGEFIKKINETECMKLSDGIDYEEGGVSSKSLVQRASFTLTLMAFSQNSRIASHSSNGDALVQVLEGKAEITIANEVFVISKDESILMPAGIPHALYAIEPFKMLLTVAKPE